MAAPLVLVTGATGFIGFAVLLDALRAGYRTRIAVRSTSKQSSILNNPYFKALQIPESSISFVTVPDLTANGAYDDAIQGVDYVIHVASPIYNSEPKSYEEQLKFYLEPALRGTLGILESALKSPSVKRVVITSSVVALKAWTSWGKPEEATTAASRPPKDYGPYQSEPHAYASSKIIALDATDKWVKDHSDVSFDVINVLPGLVQGHDLFATSSKDIPKLFEGSNAGILNVAAGKDTSRPRISSTVLLDDVAKVHVQALQKPTIPAGSYLAAWVQNGTTRGTQWEDVNDWVKKFFPEEVKNGLLPNNVVQKTLSSAFDVTDTEKHFGFKFHGLDEQVKVVVGQYVELLKSEQ
jgi:nucleoside-diphosphate-sugar epimerase